MDGKIKDRAIAHLRKHPNATVRQIRKAAGMKSMHTFYKIFPEGLEELCRLADIPFETKRRKRMDKATEARRSLSIEVGQGESIQSQFDLVLRTSKIEADFDALNKEFQKRTEKMKDDPYWFAQRKRLSTICERGQSLLREVHDEKGCAEVAEVYRKVLEDFSKLMREAPWFEVSRLAFESLQEYFQTGPGSALKKIVMVVQLVDKHGLEPVEAFLRYPDLLSYDKDFKTAVARKWLNIGIPELEEEGEIIYTHNVGKEHWTVPLLKLLKVNSVEELRPKR